MPADMPLDAPRGNAIVCSFDGFPKDYHGETVTGALCELRGAMGQLGLLLWFEVERPARRVLRWLT